MPINSSLTLLTLSRDKHSLLITVLAEQIAEESFQYSPRAVTTCHTSIHTIKHFKTFFHRLGEISWQCDQNSLLTDAQTNPRHLNLLLLKGKSQLFKPLCTSHNGTICQALD